MPDYPDDVVERVAVALAESRCWPGCWEKANEVEKSAWRHDAKAALAAAWEWRPIESAPKDGRKFLTWDKVYGIRIGRAFIRANHDDWLSYCDGFNGSSKGGARATHWMPLPQAPERDDG